MWFSFSDRPSVETEANNWLLQQRRESYLNRIEGLSKDTDSDDDDED